MAKAVAHAHQALIVHRDIKPGNILVDSKGAPHLLDFGIAKPLAQLGAQTVSMTATGQRFFSPQHAAPEQLLGGRITVGCDVYGLGCLLYELLTGEPAIPLTGLTAAEAEKKILHELPKAPSQRVGQGEESHDRATGFGSPSGKAWCKAIKGELDSIVLTCLRKLPHERYRSVDELIADVEAFQAGMPIAAKSSNGWYRTKKFVARHRWAVAAAALTAIALVSSSVITALQSREARFQRDAAQTALGQAEQQRDRAQRVTQFLIDAFAAANPGGELGKSVTAKDILDHGARKLENDLKDSPELKAQLLSTIAEAQLALDMTEDALKTARRAQSLLTSDSDPKTKFRVLARLARIHIDRKELGQVDSILNSASVHADQLEERVHLAFLKASAAQRAGKNEDILPIVIPVLAEIESSDSDYSFDDVVQLRRFQLSATSMMRSDRELENLLGVVADPKFDGLRDRVHEVKLLRSISASYRALDRDEEALHVAKRALALSEKIFGPNSVVTAGALGTLASTENQLKNYEQARLLNSMALDIAVAVYGEKTPATMTYEYNVAGALDGLGEFAAAEQIYRELTNRGEELYGADNFMLMLYRGGMARMLIALGRCEEARSVDELSVKRFSTSSQFNTSEYFQSVLARARSATPVCALNDNKR